MRRKVILFSTLAAFVGLGFLLLPLSEYRYAANPLPATFDEFLAMKLKQSADAGARQGCEERLVRFAPGQTDLAILYIHGFGASRAEGEAVMDPVSSKLKANTYYVRLPGHGTNKEDHARVRYTELLDTSEEALRAMPLLGKHIIVVGTSMGALLATHLAAEHPEQVHALIVASPFYEFYRSDANVAAYPGGLTLVELVGGGVIRDVRKKPNDPNDTRIEGYQNYWYDVQYFAALRGLAQLKRAVSKPSTFGRITSPVLMLYYYRDEEHQDKSASVPGMLDGFQQFGKFSKPNPLNRSVAIEQGDHVLMSKWVPTDKALIEKEILRFIEDVETK
ncbi:MAG: alpha/beta fold hydrolase [Spirochaetia bacterium]|nr:alpha/beta fold hydrolase [Spirochaetia bacterium]